VGFFGLSDRGRPALSFGLTTRLDHHRTYLLTFSSVRSESICEAASAIIPRSM